MYWGSDCISNSNSCIVRSDSMNILQVVWTSDVNMILAGKTHLFCVYVQCCSTAPVYMRKWNWWKICDKWKKRWTGRCEKREHRILFQRALHFRGWGKCFWIWSDQKILEHYERLFIDKYYHRYFILFAFACFSCAFNVHQAWLAATIHYYWLRICALKLVLW